MKTEDGILNATTEIEGQRNVERNGGAVGRPSPDCVRDTWQRGSAALPPRDSSSAGGAPAPQGPRRVRQDRGGFTLVELLLVLVILGTLAAIVLPKFSGVSQRGRVTAAATQISTFKTALDAYEVDMGSYPRSLMDLIVQPRNGANWHGPYLQSDAIPRDPWGNEYLYVCPGKHNPSFYDLSSAGPDGKFGDADDICNWTMR